MAQLLAPNIHPPITETHTPPPLLKHTHTITETHTPITEPHTHTHTPITEPQSWRGCFTQVLMCFCLSYRSDLATLSPHSHSCRISENTSSSNFRSNKETESEVRTLQLVSLVFLTTKLMAFKLLQYDSIKKCSAETNCAQHQHKDTQPE